MFWRDDEWMAVSCNFHSHVRWPPKLGQRHSTMRLIWRVRGFIDISYLTKDMVRQDSLGMENYIICLVSVWEYGVKCLIGLWEEFLTPKFEPTKNNDDQRCVTVQQNFMFPMLVICYFILLGFLNFNKIRPCWFLYSHTFFY